MRALIEASMAVHRSRHRLERNVGRQRIAHPLSEDWVQHRCARPEPPVVNIAAEYTGWNRANSLVAGWGDPHHPKMGSRTGTLTGTVKGCRSLAVGLEITPGMS